MAAPGKAGGGALVTSTDSTWFRWVPASSWPHDLTSVWESKGRFASLRDAYGTLDYPSLSTGRPV